MCYLNTPQEGITKKISAKAAETRKVMEQTLQLIRSWKNEELNALIEAIYKERTEGFINILEFKNFLYERMRLFIDFNELKEKYSPDSDTYKELCRKRKNFKNEFWEILYFWQSFADKIVAKFKLKALNVLKK